MRICLFFLFTDASPEAQGGGCVAQGHRVGMLCLVPPHALSLPQGPHGIIMKIQGPGICKISGAGHLQAVSLLLKSEERKAHGEGFLGGRLSRG